MATMATRSGRGLLALIFVAMACIFVVPNFSMLGSVPQSGPPAGATILHKIDEVEMRLDAGNIGEYDQKLLSEDIQILEDLVQDSMELATTTQIEWLENTLQTVATLKTRLARQRAAAFQEKGLPATFLAVGVLAFFLAGAAALKIDNTRNMTAPRNIQSRLWSSDTTKTSALHRFRRGEEFKLFTQKEEQNMPHVVSPVSKEQQNMPFAFPEDTNKRNMTAPRNIESRLWSSDATKTPALHRFRRGEEFKLFTQKEQHNMPFDFAFLEDTNKRNITAPRNIQSRLLSSSTTTSSRLPRRGEELKLVAQHQQKNTHENTSNDA